MRIVFKKKKNPFKFNINTINSFCSLWFRCSLSQMNTQTYFETCTYSLNCKMSRKDTNLAGKSSGI